MKNAQLLIACIFLSSGFCIAQNRMDFFRAVPAINEKTAEWAILMYSSNPNVYEVDHAYQEYFKYNSFVKTLDTQNYKHWRRKIDKYLDSNGFIDLPSQSEEAELVNQMTEIRNSGERAPGTWENLGPFETYESGGVIPISHQVNIYCVDQSKTNPEILFAGTEGAGIYRTSDKAMSWELCSNQMEITAVEAVQIHPNNPAIILAGGNRRIFRSTDGGDNWTEIYFLDASSHVIRFNPDIPEQIFCAASNGLYRSDDGGDSWVKMYSQSCWDIVFHPTDATVLYLLKSKVGQASTSFWKSTDSGMSWNEISNGWYQPENLGEANEQGGKIGVTVAAPNRVYAALIGDSKEGDSGWIGVFRSDDSGDTWTQSPAQIGGPYNSPNNTPWNVAAYSDGYHQGYYNFGLGVSSVNPDKIWVGTIRLSESLDGGKTFRSIGAADSQKHTRIHADIQAVLVRGADIWIASDGGLDYSNDELGTHQSRKYGITGADFWGFGSGWNEDVLVGGKYHNGNGVFYQTYGKGNFLHIGGVEEATGYVNPLENRVVYTNEYWAGGTRTQRVPTSLSGPIEELPHLPLIPNETYIESSSSGLYFDPRYSRHMYLGNEDGIWKSTNGGITFDKIYSFEEGTVHEIAISRSNPAVMYCVVHRGGFWDGCNIYRSEDSGKTWTQTTNITGDRWRMEIEIHPENPMEIWVASSRGANGSKVFQSVNGGQSWVNKSTSILNNQRMKDIMIQGGTDGIVYLATDRGIFYLENDTWNPFSVDLPYALNSLKLKPFYKENKLRLATYGRGAYETDLVAAFRPIAQAITTTDSILCTRDTVPFDCHSILLHEDAEWNWEFSPEPSYVSALNVRNPRVVFGNPGNYSVSLTVRDKFGQTSTYTATDMVKVFNQCNAEGLAGTSMQIQGDGDYLQTASLDFHSNQFTVTAWVYPDGIQPEYSAIFMNDEETAGFNFISNNNTLGYHWPNGAWWWNSGLQVPANEWSYVAMVADPEGITLYVNGKGSRHTFSAPEVWFQSAKIGSYKNWGGRNMRGNIDEVCIWNRALTEEEIRLQRHLTKDQIIQSDEDIVAYYQFNEPGSNVFDRKGSVHGFMTGNSVKSNRKVAVGSGTSQIFTEKDTHTWEATDLGITIDGGEPGSAVVENLIGSKVFGLECFLSDEGVPAPVWIFNHYPSFLDIENAELAFTHNSYQDGQLPLMSFRSENNAETNWTELSEGSSDGNTWKFTLENYDFSTGQYCLTEGEPTTAIQESESFTSLRVFPNPVITSQEVRVILGESEEGTFSVYDMNGKMKFRQKIVPQIETTISLRNLVPGNYMYVFKSNQKIANGTIQVMD